jgi:glycosyltransferase involved in cell wall biosynthesis
MDFGLLPELNAYCSPMKLFESMAMAQGMVLPASDPVMEVVADGITSWVFPMHDQAACINKVMQVFEDTQQRIQVGKNARAYIERERQWTDNVDMLLRLLSDVKPASLTIDTISEYASS